MNLLKASALMAALLVCAMLILGVQSLRGFPPRGGGASPGASMNGDVNCDGKVDLSDAISLIQFQFYDGPAPCALAQDNFATKDDLNALAARVVALEASSKQAGAIATGMYVGNAIMGRTITTGLSGRLRNVQIIAEGNEEHPLEERLDVQGAENLNGIGFSGPDFIVWKDIDFAFLNATGRRYFWIAISTPE
ncbi:MAG TPA: hypothetical protein VGR38_10155 [Candidatus Polarisedimenticolia bacterium]|jgi:hypothetical protein|nr:hypothetical protein [Candidatus Polarisedimenticolia bacterium]